MANYKQLFEKRKSKEKNFTQQKADISDLIKQMNADGLLVDSIDTSGGIVRVPVKATALSRHDKTSTGEKSGWYFFHQNNEHWISVYGNWRTNQQWKFYSNSIKDLTPEEQTNLNKAIEINLQSAKKERENKNNEVAKECEVSFGLNAVVSIPAKLIVGLISSSPKRNFLQSIFGDK